MSGVPRFKIFPTASIILFLVFSFSFLCVLVSFYMFSIFRLIFFSFLVCFCFFIELVLGLIVMPMMNNDHTFFHMKKMRDI